MRTSFFQTLICVTLIFLNCRRTLAQSVNFGDTNVESIEPAVLPNPGGPLRYDEDWSPLRNPTIREGRVLESFKYLPLSGTGETFLTFGNELRFRYELLEHPNWGEEPTDRGGYYWFRALPTADLHIGDNFRLFGELIVAPSSGVDPTPSGLDDNVVDILQAFAELKLSEQTSFDIGRKVLSIGSERLVGTRYGVNVLQSFDVVRLFHGNEKNSVFALYGRPVDAETGSFNDDWSRSRQGWTVYWSRDLADAGFAVDGDQFLDLYYMGFENTEAEFDQGSGLERRQTFAARLHGNRQQWSWDNELFVQLGRFAQTDIVAWSLATLTTYSGESLPMSPEFILQFNIVSGDRNRNDGRLGTFNPMFPRLKYFGEAGVFSPANLIALNPGIGLRLTERVQLKSDVQFLWRYSDDDGVYGAGGRLLRSGKDGDSSYIATQYEIGSEVELGKNWTGSLFYAIVPPGPFIKESGGSQTIQFVGLETNWSF